MDEADRVLFMGNHKLTEEHWVCDFNVKEQTKQVNLLLLLTCLHILHCKF